MSYEGSPAVYINNIRIRTYKMSTEALESKVNVSFFTHKAKYIEAWKESA